MKYNFEITAYASLPFTVEANSPAEAEEKVEEYIEDSDDLWDDVRKFAEFYDCSVEKPEYDMKTDFMLKNYSICLK